MKKIDRRSFLKLCGAAGAVGALAACGSSSSTAASTATSTAASAAAPASTASSGSAVTLVYNEVNPESSLAGQVATYLAEQAEALSGGSVKIDVRAGGSLMGSEADAIDDMTGPAPTVDIARISIFALDNYGVPTTRITNLPFVFTSREHYWKFAASDVGKQILTDSNTVGGLGIEGKCFFEEGFRHFFFSKPVESIEDMKGLNIRVSTSTVYMDMVKCLGASPVDVAFSELYSSLGGVCEGAEQPIANYQSNSFYDVAPYMILDGHMMGCGMMIITDSAWAKLDASQQEALQKAFDAASAYDQEISASAEADSRKICEDAGAIFTEVADKTPWQTAVASVIESNTSTQDLKDVYTAIQSLA